MTLIFNLHAAPGGRPGRPFAWLRSLKVRAWFGILVLGLSLITGVFTTQAAEEEMPVDFQVKAAFLINFPKYVDWPASVFTETNSPITVAVYGDDNVANEFESMIAGGRAVGGRPVVLKRITQLADVTNNCQILYIGAAQRQNIPGILEKVRGKKVLTVGETEEFLDKGGVVNLARQGRKIRLQVNLNAAGDAELKISSRLLMAADVVKGKAKSK
ncbi:MAG: YfiR family protein [Akkermansiaceae bacterium]|nr:YfiR family protein [Verrucomicrobiales bacterium]